MTWVAVYRRQTADPTEPVRRQVMPDNFVFELNPRSSAPTRFSLGELLAFERVTDEGTTQEEVRGHA